MVIQFLYYLVLDAKWPLVLRCQTYCDLLLLLEHSCTLYNGQKMLQSCAGAGAAPHGQLQLGTRSSSFPAGKSSVNAMYLIQVCIQYKHSRPCDTALPKQLQFTIPSVLPWDACAHHPRLAAMCQQGPTTQELSMNANSSANSSTAAVNGMEQQASPGPSVEAASSSPSLGSVIENCQSEWQVVLCGDIPWDNINDLAACCALHQPAQPSSQAAGAVITAAKVRSSISNQIPRSDLDTAGQLYNSTPEYYFGKCMVPVQVQLPTFSRDSNSNTQVRGGRGGMAWVHVRAHACGGQCDVAGRVVPKLHVLHPACGI